MQDEYSLTLKLYKPQRNCDSSYCFRQYSLTLKLYKPQPSESSLPHELEYSLTLKLYKPQPAVKTALGFMLFFQKFSVLLLTKSNRFAII